MLQLAEHRAHRAPNDELGLILVDVLQGLALVPVQREVPTGR